MNKARLISLTITLSLLAFYVQGAASGLSFLGAPCTWYDGH